MLLKGATGGGGLAPPFLALGISSEEEDEDRLPTKIPDLDAHNPPSDDEGIIMFIISIYHLGGFDGMITYQMLVSE